MKIAVSPITNRIYAGNTRKPKNGPEVWTKKTDVTDDAIRAVFEWMKTMCKDGGTRYFELKYPSSGGRMLFELPDAEVQDES